MPHFIAVFNFRFTTIGPLGHCPQPGPRPRPRQCHSHSHSPCLALPRPGLVLCGILTGKSCTRRTLLYLLPFLIPPRSRWLGHFNTPLGEPGRAGAGESFGGSMATLCYNNVPSTSALPACLQSNCFGHKIKKVIRVARLGPIQIPIPFRIPCWNCVLK